MKYPLSIPAHCFIFCRTKRLLRARGRGKCYFCPRSRKNAKFGLFSTNVFLRFFAFVSIRTKARFCNFTKNNRSYLLEIVFLFAGVVFWVTLVFPSLVSLFYERLVAFFAPICLVSPAPGPKTSRSQKSFANYWTFMPFSAKSFLFELNNPLSASRVSFLPVPLFFISYLYER